MNNIEILDCTLRDGGYINNWNFGKKNIDMIFENLISSNVDYIELGYIDRTCNIDINSTKFNSLKDLEVYGTKFSKSICMIDFGKYPIEEIPNADESNVFGIRVAFSKKDVIAALEYCKQLKDKGYNVFVQPMVTASYSIKEINALLDEINKMKPYALYIVDSFGSMNEKKVIELLNAYTDKLSKNVIIGFHSHNNLQLAYSNAKVFIENAGDRKVIVDSSVYGMGRGSGNLATELIANYLNDNDSKEINVNAIIEIIDNYLLELKKEKKWGYCLEYYLSAVNDCHPNYAKYLSEMHTMTINDIKTILHRIANDKKAKFNEEYINELYTAFMNKKIDDNNSYAELKTILNNKKVLILGSGETLKLEKEKIDNIIDDNTVIISLNEDNQIYNSNYIFISNRRRYKNLDDNNSKKLICTSNVSIDTNNHLIFDYFDNLANDYENSDNVLLMFINILIKADINEIYLAGFDGFSCERKNFYSDELSYITEKERADRVNSIMNKYIKLYSKKIKLNWVTDSNYIKEENK